GLAPRGVGAPGVCPPPPRPLPPPPPPRGGRHDAPQWVLDQAFPADRAAPLVTLLDGHPHTLAFLGTVHNTPVTPLGVTHFGQSGALDEVYRHHGIDTESVVRAALDLTHRP
ncbi:pyruvate dehydrogenase, partial [Streptomyces sp. PGLac3x]